jgi:hypothetical protein
VRHHVSMRGPDIVGSYALAAFAAVFLVACGGGGDVPAAGPATATSSAATLDACALVTAAEIEASVRAAVGSPQHGPGSMPGGPISICQWPRAGGGPFMPFVQVSVTPNAASSYDAWMAEMARDLGESLDPATNRRVDGIGDWAVYTEDARTLLVGVGRRLVHVMVNPEAGQAEATTLARVAVSRLPD